MIRDRQAHTSDVIQACESGRLTMKRDIKSSAKDNKSTGNVSMPFEDGQAGPDW